MDFVRQTFHALRYAARRLAIHPVATPVLLLDEDARAAWMHAPWEVAQDLQRPPPAGALRVVAAGVKEDG